MSSDSTVELQRDECHVTLFLLSKKLNSFKEFMKFFKSA